MEVGGGGAWHKLQSVMKRDPESYSSELRLIYRQFKYSIDVFEQQPDWGFKSVNSDASFGKEVGGTVYFLAQLTSTYPQYLSDFPELLVNLLHRMTTNFLPSYLRPIRLKLAQALILLLNKKVLFIDQKFKMMSNSDTQTTLVELLMKLQTMKDKELRKKSKLHVLGSIEMHKNNHARNMILRKAVISMLKSEDEALALRSLDTLFDLHQKNIWTDDETCNAICLACLSPPLRKAALFFIVKCQKTKDDDGTDASSSEDEACTRQLHVSLNRDQIYKAHHTGTTSSKKRKIKKVLRDKRRLKKEQRLASDKTHQISKSLLLGLADADDFVDKLLSSLNVKTKDKEIKDMEVKVMAIKVIARTIGLHKLIKPKFYVYLLKYLQPHQRYVTELLAAAVEAFHPYVLDDDVKELFNHIVDRFVDGCLQEGIALGLNVIREISIRIPRLMDEDLLQHLALFKKSHNKAVASAAQSLILLFREVNPSLLVKKDRGRFADLGVRPKQLGEITVARGVPGAELLLQRNVSDNEDRDLCTQAFEKGDDDAEGDVGDDYIMAYNDFDDSVTVGEKGREGEVKDGKDEEEEEEDDDDEDDNGNDACLFAYDGCEDGVTDKGFTESGSEVEDECKITAGEEVREGEVRYADDVDRVEEFSSLTRLDDSHVVNSVERKRRYVDFDRQMDIAESSLRALKKLTTTKLDHLSETDDHFYSNEEFREIKRLRRGLEKCSDSKSATFKVPSFDQLIVKPLNPAKLDPIIRRKMNKEERVETMLAGREGRDKYRSRTAIKQNKKGGSSNLQKDHKKFMPIAAKRSKIARSKQEKKRKQMTSSKQFRGKKAWK